MKLFLAVALICASTFSYAQTLDNTIVRVPVGQTNGIDNSKLILGGYAALTGQSFIAEEWDIKTNKVKPGGEKLFARSETTGSSSDKKTPTYGNLIVGLTGSDMAANDGNLPMSFDFGAKAAKGYALVLGGFNIAQGYGGYGGSMHVSPLTETNLPIKPILGYRYYKTKGMPWSYHSALPLNQEISSGPSVGFLSPLPQNWEMMVQVIKANRTKNFYPNEYAYGKTPDLTEKSKGWSFAVGFVYNILPN